MATSATRRPTGFIVIAVGLAITFAGLDRAAAAEASVDLGTADSFAVVAGSTVTNTGPTVLSGDLGVSPGTAVTGFPPGIVNNGTVHAADAVAAQAQADVTSAYNDAAGRSTSATVSADLGGQTLVAGVYTAPTLGLTGTLTLDAQGDASAVFILQAASTLKTATASAVELIGGADACNVFWQVGSSATLGTGSALVGTVLALTSVTAQTGATVHGRLLARNAAVTLDTNVITRPTCALPPTGPTTTVPTTTATTTSTGATTTTGQPATSTTTSSSGATTTTVRSTTSTVAGAPSTTVQGAGTSTTALGATTTAVRRPTTTTSAATATSGVATPAPRAATTTTGGSSRDTTAAASAATAGLSARAAGTAVSGAAGSTGVSSTPTTGTAGRLAATGSPLTATFAAGLLVVIIGSTMLVASRQPVTGRRVHR